MIFYLLKLGHDNTQRTTGDRGVADAPGRQDYIQQGKENPEQQV